MNIQFITTLSNWRPAELSLRNTVVCDEDHQTPEVVQHDDRPRAKVPGFKSCVFHLLAYEILSELLVCVPWFPHVKVGSVKEPNSVLLREHNDFIFK